MSYCVQKAHGLIHLRSCQSQCESCRWREENGIPFFNLTPADWQEIEQIRYVSGLTGDHLITEWLNRKRSKTEPSTYVNRPFKRQWTQEGSWGPHCLLETSKEDYTIQENKTSVVMKRVAPGQYVSQRKPPVTDYMAGHNPLAGRLPTNRY